MTSLDELFEGRMGSAEFLAERKAAIGDPDRYRALYYVYDHQDEKVFEEDLPTDDLEPLYDTNLLAHIPHPDGRFKVRITQLGIDEIEADLRWLEDIDE